MIDDPSTPPAIVGDVAPDAAAPAAPTHWQAGTVPDAAVRLVRRLETFSATPYRDSAQVWTIGFGSTRDASGAAVTSQTPPITSDTAAAWLARDLQASAIAIARRVTVPLTVCQASALISFTYNEGPAGFATSTLLKRLNAGDWQGATAELPKWVYAGGKPSLGLLRRRWAEFAVFNAMDPTIACNLSWSRITQLGQWPALP